jgi:hypothetical protein
MSAEPDQLDVRPPRRPSSWNQVILTAVGFIVGGTLGAEFGLLINPPILPIVMGILLGAACGVMVPISRLSPVVAYVLVGMSCYFFLHFPYTVRQGALVVIVGVSLGIVSARFPRAVAWPAMGVLFALAIIVIPCQSYGQPVSEWLRNPKQLPFVVGMAICAWVVAIMTVNKLPEHLGRPAGNRRSPPWPWYIAAGILAFLVVVAISTNERRPPL